MATTTMGVKLDEVSRERLRLAAAQLGRTPHWVIKQAIYTYIDQIERGCLPPELAGVPDLGISAEGAGTQSASVPTGTVPQPFLEFAQGVQPQSVLRAAITAAYRRPEPECVPLLLTQARLPGTKAAVAEQMAAQLVTALRQKNAAAGREGLVQGLIHEFSLSSQEGVALMCLAEALLRIPDRGTRDALIRDKLARGDWRAHIGHSPSLFVNAAAWGLLITGKLVSTQSEAGLSHALTRVIGKSGEPLIRKGVDMAMRLMGEQFVTGENIAEALARARKMEARGFRYSYDMLGEAAMNAADAQRYTESYVQAIRAIGQAAAGRGIYEGPGISVKLSALHPRYSRAQAERVMAELYPRLKMLALMARQADIGLNIDAEEADRLELSLDLLERLCFEPELAGWNGIGFVVQAYQKRAPFVLDWLIDLAHRSRRRLMVRLVKGAYWDSEIKRAQVDGLEGYPVYTRKVYTDVSYLACAQKLLAAPDAIYPQFATHNAHTLAAIIQFGGENYYPGQYEFQCLHGMGEPLYEEITGSDNARLRRPCRIYAPVGTHETLLAYLVRRLLENGANTSFVNRIADERVPVSELIADPVDAVQRMPVPGEPHPQIPLPADLHARATLPRRNSAGIDLSNEQRLASLSAALLSTGAQLSQASALPERATEAAAGHRDEPAAAARPVLNPADRRDVVGSVVDATLADVERALAQASGVAPIWEATSASARVAVLERAAMLLEHVKSRLLALAVREAGKTLPNAIGEVREAIDFLNYYAVQLRCGTAGEAHDASRPLGPVVCISPWNFPLAIFIGQISAALAAGNVVLAKPAEQTPLIAAEAVRALHQALAEAGLPPAIVQLLPGAGETVGAALVADTRVRGVMFTGSTEVARILRRALAGRLDAAGRPIPLVAETGGQNAMIVDSSALAEQVVADVVASAFDSAGQRCSALRVLCLQDEVADRILDMLKGAMAELQIGAPDRLAADVGPVIDAEAQAGIEAHIAAMRAHGYPVHALALPDAARHGTFVAPTLIEIPGLSVLGREVFGPVLHVVRYRREALDALLYEIRATGYGLTMGVHTRLDETVAHIATRAHVGNLYVNRNVVGAVVGVQPFGGEGLSGTGPKAGGVLVLPRLRRAAGAGQQPWVRPGSDEDVSELLPQLAAQRASIQAVLAALADWCEAGGLPVHAGQARALAADVPCGSAWSLSGPTGEHNLYLLQGRGRVLCAGSGSAAGSGRGEGGAGAAGRSNADALAQCIAALACGNTVWLLDDAPHRSLFEALRPVLAHALPEGAASPVQLAPWAALPETADAESRPDLVLFSGDSDRVQAWSVLLAGWEGALVGLEAAPHGTLAWPLQPLLAERSISINTAAAGGNASLMTIG